MWQEGDGSWVLGVNKVFAAQSVVQVVSSAARGSMKGGFACMSSRARADIEVSNTYPILLGVFNAFEIDVDDDSEWELRDNMLFGELDIYSSLYADLALVRHKYLVGAL